MDKKKLIKNLPVDDLKGFEEFIEGEPNDSSFLPKPGIANSSKKEVSFEHFTFLTHDSERLLKLKNLIAEKIPFSAKFDQSSHLIILQNDSIIELKKKIFGFSEKENSAYQRSLSEIFNSFFDPPKT